MEQGTYARIVRHAERERLKRDGQFSNMEEDREGLDLWYYRTMLFGNMCQNILRMTTCDRGGACSNTKHTPIPDDRSWKLFGTSTYI